MSSSPACVPRARVLQPCWPIERLYLYIKIHVVPEPEQASLGVLTMIGGSRGEAGPTGMTGGTLVIRTTGSWQKSRRSLDRVTRKSTKEQ